MARSKGETHARLVSEGGWGKVGSADMFRYADQISTPTRRRCPWCRSRITHVGKANGLALMSGCELCVARWVRHGWEGMS